MSKMRKGVDRKKDKSTTSATSKKQSPTLSSTIARDAYLYHSSKQAYILSIILLIVSIWTSANIFPFNKLRALNAPVMELICAGICLLLFVFILLAWGNALEIRGEVLEWKHVLVALLATVFIGAWGGTISFMVLIFGCFAILTWFWYAQK
jgi:cation transport ATPase